MGQKRVRKHTPKASKFRGVNVLRTGKERTRYICRSRWSPSQRLWLASRYGQKYAGWTWAQARYTFFPWVEVFELLLVSRRHSLAKVRWYLQARKDELKIVPHSKRRWVRVKFVDYFPWPWLEASTLWERTIVSVRFLSEVMEWTLLRGIQNGDPDPHHRQSLAVPSWCLSRCCKNFKQRHIQWWPPINKTCQKYSQGENLVPRRG